MGAPIATSPGDERPRSLVVSRRRPTIVEKLLQGVLSSDDHRRDKLDDYTRINTNLLV
jgi:hypothetical protein